MPLLVLLLALIRLPDGGHTEDTLRLVTVADTLHYVQVADYAGRVERWPLPYPVYRFQTGDINGDGRTDVLVGVIKSTRYDPQVARRLFIFMVYKDRYIRPLWMGSRLSHPLVDFRFAHIDGQPRVLTAGHHARALPDGRLSLAFLRPRLRRLPRPRHPPRRGSPTARGRADLLWADPSRPPL